MKWIVFKFAQIGRTPWIAARPAPGSLRIRYFPSWREALDYANGQAYVSEPTA